MTEFHVGDTVYSRYFGRGIITEISERERPFYPITVKWVEEKKKHYDKRDSFMINGQFNTQYPDPEYDIIKEEDENTEFKIMDRVFYPFYGKGTVVEARKTDESYPIRVVWDKPPYKNEPWSSFTRDGIMSISRFVGADEVKLILVKDIPKEETGGSEVGQIASIINSNIAKKMKEDEEKMSPDDRKFKVGERVWSPYFGGGTVTAIDDKAGDIFPITVHWNDGYTFCDCAFFTEDGKYTLKGDNPEKGIYHIDPKDAEKVLPNILHELVEDEDESTVERMEDAINPSHYKVDGLPEAIDIMNHLMTPEQFEGFLWGNIMKYAYRYGRKGDKAETAGKIAWYANQLKALEEWRKENET